MMAFCDYYLCDWCGCKCFYDADITDRIDSAGDIQAICKECAKTHEVVVVVKGAVGEDQ